MIVAHFVNVVKRRSTRHFTPEALQRAARNNEGCVHVVFQPRLQPRCTQVDAIALIGGNGEGSRLNQTPLLP